MDTIHLGDTRVKMIAHRGMSGLEAENTASAFVAAGNRSYFGIETDVHVTADGEFIIIHDDQTGRVALDDMTVEKTTFETLRSLRLCDKDGQKGRKDLMLPSLLEYVRICKKYEKQSVLELKNHFESKEIDRIIEMIRSEGWLEHTIFISFDLPNMLCIRERLPQQPAQYLTKEAPEGLIDTLRAHSLDLDIKHTALTPELVTRLHEAGVKVNTWTVDTLEDAHRAVECGVDFITSNILE